MDDAVAASVEAVESLAVVHPSGIAGVSRGPRSVFTSVCPSRTAPHGFAPSPDSDFGELLEHCSSSLGVSFGEVVRDDVSLGVEMMVSMLILNGLCRTNKVRFIAIVALLTQVLLAGIEDLDRPPLVLPVHPGDPHRQRDLRAVDYRKPRRRELPAPLIFGTRPSDHSKATRLSHGEVENVIGSGATPGVVLAI